MLKTTCHCGAVQIDIAHPPETLIDGADTWKVVG